MVEITNINKSYKSKRGRTVKAIQDISLNLPSKGLVFIVGKSGSGKSTLLNLIGRLDTVDSGKIIINGQDITNFTTGEENEFRNRMVGFVFQEFNLFESFIVEKNIALALNLQGQKDVKQEVERVLKVVELENEIEHFPSELSGGQRQRVAIARAIIKKPQILLCDEPTGSLDSLTSKTILELLKKISQDSLVIVVSHDIENAKNFADRIIYMSDGRISEDTSPINEIEQKVIPSRKPDKLPFRTTFALTRNFLFRKPIRLIMAFILCVISFILLSFSSTLAFNDYTAKLLNTLYLNDMTYVTLQRRDWGIADDNIKTSTAFNMDDSDIETIKKNNNLDHLDIVYRYHNSPYSNIAQERSDYYPHDSNGFVEVTQEFLSRYNFGFYGQLPSNFTEVVISDYVFSMYQQYGYTSGEGTIKIVSYDDLIGKTLNVQSIENNPSIDFKITGIVNTNFNNTRYREIEKLDPQSDKYAKLSAELDQLKLSGLHTLLFVKTGYYDYFHESTKSSISITGSLKVEDHSSLVYRLSLNQLNDEDVFFKTEVHELSKTQIIVPLSHLGWFAPDFQAETLKITKTLAEEFAEANYTDVFSYFGNPSMYAYYIVNSSTNEYHPQYNYDYFRKIAVRSYIEAINAFDYYDDITLSSPNFNYQLEVVGFTDSPEISINNIIVSPLLLDEIRIKSGKDINPYWQVIVPLSGNKRQDMQLLKFTNKLHSVSPYEHLSTIYTDRQYIYQSEIAYSFERVEGLLVSLSPIFLVASIGFGFFAAIFIFFYFSGTIVDKQTEIGILKSLGTRRIDIFKIFIIQNIIISLSTVLVSWITTIIGIGYFNEYFIEEFYLIVSIIDVSVLHILLVVLFALFISLLGSIFPILKIVIKRPVDIIRQSKQD